MFEFQSGLRRAIGLLLRIEWQYPSGGRRLASSFRASLVPL